MSTPAPGIRVVITDDHPVFRFRLRAVLRSQAGIEVVGEAASGAEAVALVEAQTPDVILMDVTMPDGSGIEATRAIIALGGAHATAVLVLTMLDDEATVLEAMRAGAWGYIVKGSGGDEIIRAIRAVAAGEAIFGQPIAARLLRQFADSQAAPGGSVDGSNRLFPELTQREMEVLSLLAEGLTNAAIADRLFVSQKTVRNHVSSIFGKLQVTDRGQAIVRARDAGFG